MIEDGGGGEGEQGIYKQCMTWQTNNFLDERERRGYMSTSNITTTFLKQLSDESSLLAKIAVRLGLL